MALTEKLKAIANAIRSKINKTEELTLEQMASEVSDINTLQGLDFSSIYDQEQADEINQYYKDGIEYAKSIDSIVDSVSNWANYFLENTNIVYFPAYDKSLYNPTFMFYRSSIQYVPYIRVTGTLNMMFQNAGALKKVVLDVGKNGSNFNQIFSGCLSLRYCEIINCKDAYLFNATFNNCYSLETLKISNWNQKNISLAQSAKLSPESIHYIIQNAVDVVDGATARTLYLHATAKINWMNSEYYEQDEITRITKGIEIA